MRWWLVVASLWLLVVAMTIPETEGMNRPRGQEGGTRQVKRKRDGQGLGRTRAGRSRPLKIRLVPGPNVPAEPRENQGNTLFLESYKNLHEQHSSYNVIPGKQGQCVYQGLTMFDQAVWSPKPCVTCLCTRGRVVCDEITCPKVQCHFPFIPTGQCCPACMEPVPSDPREPETPLTHEEIQRILWREEEEHREEEERLRKKDEARKKRRKQRKEQAEKQRRIVEERRRQEEEALRLQVEKEEEEWRQKEERRLEEERRRQEEEDRRQKEAVEREAREREKKLEEERRRQERY
ncbi:hypothetical protein INR49_014184 [Caranx melampygus]|nr:hypothetical protein INR49_014184 [Caranx melampygus]